MTFLWFLNMIDWSIVLAYFREGGRLGWNKILIGSFLSYLHLLLQLRMQEEKVEIWVLLVNLPQESAFSDFGKLFVMWREKCQELGKTRWLYLS